jgi:hypothetical protein
MRRWWDLEAGFGQGLCGERKRDMRDGAGGDTDQHSDHGLWLFATLSALLDHGDGLEDSHDASCAV